MTSHKANRFRREAEPAERTARRLLFVVDAALVVSSAVFGYLVADYAAEFPAVGVWIGAATGWLAAMSWLLSVRKRPT